MRSNVRFKPNLVHVSRWLSAITDISITDDTTHTRPHLQTLFKIKLSDGVINKSVLTVAGLQHTLLISNWVHFYLIGFVSNWAQC